MKKKLNANKMKIKHYLAILTYSVLFSCSGPEPMIVTEAEKKWNDSIQKVYPYEIVLFKGIIMNGIPDCGDNSFKIQVYFSKANDTLGFYNQFKKEATDIAKSYSRIRDYKDCVKFIYVKFIDTINYENNFGAKYDIYKDKIQTGIEVY